MTQDTTIWPLLDHAKKIKASDIHIAEGENVWYRVDWILSKIENTKVSSEVVERILSELLHWNQTTIDNFKSSRDWDFAYMHSDGTPFRVNAFYKIWKMAFVLRRIASEANSMETLWLPTGATKFTKAKWWLILVTGPTGSGKSTTMVSILDRINEERKEHILTIEDPIEFIFKDKSSIFSQREIWKDTKSFPRALRAAMREDPDIVMVWEMRDKETVEARVELAETWHLVISTLHTSGSVQTITRLVNFFHPELQHSFRYKLWDILFGVLSQRLVPKLWWGRIWIFELMLMTPGIRNLIRSWDLVQIANTIEMWQSEWMVSMKTYADRLRDSWVIEESSYINFFKDDF